MTKTIRIRGNRPRNVKAKVFGDWAVHVAVNDNQGAFGVTYVPSGYALSYLVGWAVDDERAAVAVAKRLTAIPRIPKRLWGETTFPGSEAKDWACLIESVAAEVLAEVAP